MIGSNDREDALPLHCYGVHPTDGTLILLKRGETGFWPADGYSMGPFQNWDQVADFLNDRRHISRAQRAAMESGSVFGWECPAADPRRYDPATGRFQIKAAT